MNTQHQSLWEDLARRKRKSIQSKKHATSLILTGVIILMITFALIFILAIVTNFGDYHNVLGDAIIYFAIFTVAAGFIGVVFLATGYWRQANANHRLWEIEQERRVVKLQIKSDEENSWPGSTES